MATRGSRAIATGLILTMLAVSFGVSSSGRFGFFLSFAGVLAGINLIAGGVWMADDPAAPIVPAPAVLIAACATAHRLRRDLALAGLHVASSAVAAAAGETAPVLHCFCVYALLLLGLSLINVGLLRK
ncbi:hypothetical protein BS78_07G067500 [Paspalum vaginatum]|nr:hypothetical protein BS78_07G067500 [Paspalum vaginatum]